MSGLIIGVNMKYKSGDLIDYTGFIYLLMDHPNKLVCIKTKGVEWKYQEIKEGHDQYNQILKYGKKLWNAWDRANKILLDDIKEKGVKLK